MWYKSAETDTALRDAAIDAANTAIDGGLWSNIEDWVYTEANELLNELSV
jgi:hypothetical protein